MMKRKLLLSIVCVVLTAIAISLVSCGSKKDQPAGSASETRRAGTDANETQTDQTKIKVTLIGGKTSSSESKSDSPEESKTAGSGDENGSSGDKKLVPLETVTEITDEAEAAEIVKKYSEVGELKADAKTPGIRLIVEDGDRVVAVPLKYSFPEWLELQKKPVFLDFWAETCGPCVIAGPYVNGFAPYFKDNLLTVQINVNDAPSLAQAFSIQAIPTFMLFQDEKAFMVQRGFNPNDQPNLWNKVEDMLKK